MAQPTTLFFDLGNVLLFFDHDKMAHQVATVCGFPREVFRTLMLRYGDAYERGTVHSQQIVSELAQLSAAPIQFEAVMDALGDIFTPNLPTIDLALQLKAKGHPLFLLSNTCEAHFKYALEHYPFLKQFDGYVLSYEVNACKPEPEIYRTALHIAGCRAEECFFTDDLAENIHAARSLQIDAERYTSTEELVQHLAVRGML